MEFSKFLGEIRRNELRSAYLFVGKEDYLIEIGIQELISRVLTPDEKDLNLSVLTAKDTDAISKTLYTPPMFAARRVILIKQAGDLKDKILEDVVAFLKKLPNDVCLILWAGEPDKRKSFSKLIDKLLDPVMCNKLKTNELQTWIAEYASKYGKKLDSEAISRLCAVNWPSLRELAGELDRLTLMIGAKEVITTVDIEEMGGASFGFERWRFADAIGAGDVSAALVTLKNLQDFGLKPNQIVGDLYRCLRQLWFIKWHIDQKKVAEAKAKLGVQEFIFSKLQRQAGAFSIAQLEEALLRVLDAELSIKQGNRDDEIEAMLVVTDVLAALTSGNRKRGAA